MKKYHLKFTMIDGTEDYDFTEMTNNTIEQTKR